MKRQPPPLRFLGAVALVWVCGRAVVLAPGWWVEPGVAAPATVPRPVARAAGATAPGPIPATAAQTSPVPQLTAAAAQPTPLAERASERRHAPAALPFKLLALPGLPAPVADRTSRSLPLPTFRADAQLSSPNRLSGSAWLLLREERSAGLAPGGTLGGSQAGLRMLYRLNGDPARPLALSARFHSPSRSLRGAEAALGLDWRPLTQLPVHLLAERRQALGRDGRSAFALAVHGGLSDYRLPGGLRLDAYAQAGVVGAQSRDLFADGAARVTFPVGEVNLGAGMWGGAQPGAARLDAGPHASIRLSLAGEAVRLSAEWRMRVAGDARPGSGPVLNLGSDF